MAELKFFGPSPADFLTYFAGKNLFQLFPESESLRFSSFSLFRTKRSGYVYFSSPFSRSLEGAEKIQRKILRHYCDLFKVRRGEIFLPFGVFPEKVGPERVGRLPARRDARTCTNAVYPETRRDGSGANICGETSRMSNVTDDVAHS